MKRNLWTAVMLTVALATAVSLSAAVAEEGDNTAHTSKGGIGFRTAAAPIGVRWWFTKNIGLDLGAGFTSEKLNYTDVNFEPADESFTTISLDAGLPWLVKSWDKVHFIFRPGFTWESADNIDLFFLDAASVVNPAKKKITDYSVTGELEVELFLAENTSISAAHGFGFASTKNEDDDKANTVFGTFGSNVTTLGFHVYLWK